MNYLIISGLPCGECGQSIMVILFSNLSPHVVLELPINCRV